MQRTRTVLNKSVLVCALATTALTLSACGGDGKSAGGASDAGGSAQASHGSDRTEVGALTPRITLAHDGGVTVLDAADGEIVGQEKLKGYTRLGPAGDGRHVILAANESFRALDTGLIAQAHGDHYHYYAQSPALLEQTIKAPHPGHVVVHGERTALFSDGTGEMTVFDPAALEDGDFGDAATSTTDAPHHGVAVPLTDGGLLHTEGTEDSRSSVVVEDADGNEIARTDDCPGVHGEAAAQPTAQGDVIALGCENGPVVYRDGAFHKVAPIPGSERSGNLKGVDSSPIVLADGEAATSDGSSQGSTVIGLLNTRDDTMRTVDLGSPYWFRSLDRGANGEVLVLTGDGELNIIDPESGEVVHEVKATGEWTEPEDWQEPGPMLAVADGTAFVVDPAAKKLVMIDIASGETYRELELPVVPYEIQVTTGSPTGETKVAGSGHGASDEGGAHEGHEGHDHEGEGHEGHDHEHEDHEGHDHEGETPH